MCSPVNLIYDSLHPCIYILVVLGECKTGNYQSINPAYVALNYSMKIIVFELRKDYSGSE